MTSPPPASSGDSSPGPLLRVVDLSKTFETGGEAVPALGGVSLEVAPGEFVGVMGPSGSGKSTLLHCIAGLENATSGEVWLEGAEISTMSDRECTLLRRRLIGFVFQFFHLVPNLTVEENILLPLLIAGRPESEAREALRETLEGMAIDGKLGAYPHQLSGGEMQRASIARALVTRPPLLLADEPTGNLASKAGEEVMRILREACDRRGQAVLLVTHNPRDGARADRLYFLRDGSIDPAQILEGEEVHAAGVHARLQELGI